jgi:hypothetical protein
VKNLFCQFGCILSYSCLCSSICKQGLTFLVRLTVHHQINNTKRRGARLWGLECAVQNRIELCLSLSVSFLANTSSATHQIFMCSHSDMSLQLIHALKGSAACRLTISFTECMCFAIVSDNYQALFTTNTKCARNFCIKVRPKKMLKKEVNQS